MAPDPWNRDLLRTLEPGATYEFDGTIPVVARRPGYTTGKDGLSPGKYFVRVSLNPFPVSPRVRRQLIAELQPKGELWWEPTMTVPLEIEIPLHRRVMPCDV